MNLLVFLFISFVVLAAAYRVIGNYLARVFALSREEGTPAHVQRDGLDYEPIRASYLLPQHFSAIAAAGPIVGPILAALYFGWGPAWLWILLGSVLIGGVHDFTALVASVRHKGRSVAEIVSRYMNRRAYILFLIFVWSALVYVIVAFADVTAGAFVQAAISSEGAAPGPAVATSSAIYLLLAVFMGLALKYTKLGPVRAKMIFLPLVAVAIIVGPYIPIDLSGIVPAGKTQQVWGYVLLGYCFVAAMVPVWILLQPRGELGGYFLYIVMIAGVVGVAIETMTGEVSIAQPFFKGWTYEMPTGVALPLFPILFITVACGACSGFHSIVSSGTTSKQLDREVDAQPVAYGSMLLEGFFACISLATIMILQKPSGGPDAIYSNGIATFATSIVTVFGVSHDHAYAILYQFALLCFATFVFDTLDACTRLARYILMELFGWTTRAQAYLATAISLTLPVLAVSLPRVVVGGVPMPLWRAFWAIFGSSNQLLAALTLLGVTVWLARKGFPYWITLWPTLFMMVMTLWSLILMIGPYMNLVESHQPIPMIEHLKFGIVVSLIFLSIWLVVEALITWHTMTKPPEPALAREPALT